jgi:hypothetical protein
VRMAPSPEKPFAEAAACVVGMERVISGETRRQFIAGRNASPGEFTSHEGKPEN